MKCWKGNVMVKILFICHGNILRRTKKFSCGAGFRHLQGVYYTTTTPIDYTNYYTK